MRWRKMDEQELAREPADRCDACGGEPATWVLAEDYANAAGELLAVASGAWACDACIEDEQAAPAPATPANTAPDPLAFTHGVLELVVEEAKRREAVVAGVRDALDGLLGSADASDLGGWIREELEAQLAKLRTAMDPGLQAPAEPTTDETLTSKVTPHERLLVARLLEQADAAIATMRTHIEMRARIAELEHDRDECVAVATRLSARIGEHNALVDARIAELEQDVRTFVAAESTTRDVVNATARAMRRKAAMQPLPQRPWPVARQVAEWAGKLEDAVAPPLWGLYSDGTEAFIREWRRTRTRAPRAASSAARAASADVQAGAKNFAYDPVGLERAREEAFREAAGQAKSAGKPAGSAEHGTQAPTAGPVPAARQTARAAEKQARDASFEAECRRRESNRQRGPPSARDVAHAEQKKATKKKQTKRAAVRRRSPGKRGSP